MAEPTQTAPQPVAVSHSVISIQETEFLITQGRSVVLITDKHNAKVEAETIIHWMHTLSMSPAATMHLCTMLQEGLMRYQQMYGKIALDNNLEQRITGGFEGNPH